MKNLCLSLLLFAAIVLSSTAQAQVINGDLNHNQGLDVEDVTLLIDGYLTGASEVIETNSDYYKVDNSLIVGTWYISKNVSFVFEADGTYGQFFYKFIPAQGEVLVSDNDGNVTFDYRVIYLADDVMILKLNDGTYLKMTRTIPPQRVTSITLSATKLWLKPDGYDKLTATVLPTDADNSSVEWISSDETVAIVSQKGMGEAVGEGTATITCMAVDGSGVFAVCEVTVVDTAPGQEYVDLGLSVKWAPMNIGAVAPEDYGDLFAWGETKPKNFYAYTNYAWYSGYSEITVIKYCTNSFYGTVDNKTVLDLENDAAHINWGGTWRMPTYDEWNELKERCMWEWTSLNGVNGRKVTGPSGNFIFLPAAGGRSDDPVEGPSSDNVGRYGGYWSSSLTIDYPTWGWRLGFDSSKFSMEISPRDCGQSVRAVCP